MAVLNTIKEEAEGLLDLIDRLEELDPVHIAVAMGVPSSVAKRCAGRPNFTVGSAVAPDRDVPNSFSFTSENTQAAGLF